MDTQEVKVENEELEVETAISETEQQVMDLKDQLLRALAEAENTRRRSLKDKEEALKYGVTNLARDIVGVSDNLQRMLSNKSENAAELAESLFTGVDLILQDLNNIFARHGIQRIEASGQQFDPHSHQAVFEEETLEHAPGTVVQVIQDGYKIHERLLRPAMVSVSKSKTSEVSD